MSTERRTATELDWSTSSYSAGDGGECVEVASTGHVVLVRDSKDTARPHVTVSPAGWADFLRYAAGG
ncbi:DUF397 domain-containing protein [Streptomyces sp. NPDC005899]|uniref:DUF397 domain-containing protein n=1 Tax=Streptomyces sp. NPDC005899 TaxID=3155716 RepID=UPI0033EC3EFA